MTPIYDRHGRVIAWLRSDVIFDLNGAAQAFLKDDRVISYAGGHLGRLDRGFFRDCNGGAVAWLEGARGGPLRPMRQLRPLRPMTQLLPLKPLIPLAPLKPLPQMTWGLNWDAFINGASR
jgi:hypothetical protein